MTSSIRYLIVDGWRAMTSSWPWPSYLSSKLFAHLACVNAKGRSLLRSANFALRKWNMTKTSNGASQSDSNFCFDSDNRSGIDLKRRRCFSLVSEFPFWEGMVLRWESICSNNRTIEGTLMGPWTFSITCQTCQMIRYLISQGWEYFLSLVKFQRWFVISRHHRR